MSLFQTVCVTGANKGIGLQFVKHFLKLGNANVIATYRDPKRNNDLNELTKLNSNLSLLQLDVKDYSKYEDFCKKVAAIVGDQGLSLLINNAGIFVKGDLNQITPEAMLENFEVNTVAPLMLSKALLPLLKQSAKSGKKTVIAHITSKMGSIDDNTSGNYYAYRASKAALNIVGKSMSIDLKKDKIDVTLLHPGWVQTDMGGKNALLTTEQSVSSMIGVLNSASDLNGNFLSYDGKLINW